MTLTVLGFAGSLNRPSKTRTLVELAVQQVTKDLGAQTKIFDLMDLPQIGPARSVADLSGPEVTILRDIIKADALVVGTPVHNGSYAGLFKHVFDLIDPLALAGKPVLLTATGGGAKHALMIEHQLRPLFAFFEAAVAPTAIYASSSDFTEGLPASPALLARLERGVSQMTRQLLQAA